MRLSPDARRILAIAVGAAAGATVLRYAPEARPAPADGPATLAALRRLPPPARSFAPRTTLAQPFRACPTAFSGPGLTTGPPPCPSEALAPHELSRLSELVAAARASSAARVDPLALYALALVDLVWSGGAGKSLDRSISSLRTASRLLERPAGALVDLSAALLVRADRRGDGRDILEAAESAALALETDSLSAAARYNHALALDRLGLVDEARNAWLASAALSPHDEWGREARARARQVDLVARWSGIPHDPSDADLAAAVRRAPQEARLHGWEHALQAWGCATLAGDRERASHELRSARTLGRLLEAGGGDATLADAVRVIDEAVDDPGASMTLAEAHCDFGKAMVAYEAGAFEAAALGLERARRAPGPLGDWSRTFAAAADVYGRAPKRGERALRSVIATTDERRHPALVARARWMLGTTLLRSARREEALEQLLAAAETFDRIGEAEHHGAVRAIAAHAAYALGDSRTTIDVIREALVALRPFGRSPWRYNALYTAALAAERDGFRRVALVFQTEAVIVAARSRNVALETEARMVRARLRAGSQGGQDAELAAVHALLGRLPPGRTRDWLAADLRGLEAALPVPGLDGSRVRRLDSVVSFFERPPIPARLVPALIARADARLRTGDGNGADADLERAVRLLAAERDATDSLPLRASLMDAASQVMGRAVMSRLARNDVRGALARLELWRVPSAPPLGRAPPLPRVDEGTVALVYADIGDTLLVWDVRDTLVRVTRRIVPRHQLADLIEHARASLELRTSDQAGASLARLHRLLVDPVRERLGPPGTPLVIIADRTLGTVPFAALRDAARGRYLVEDHPLRFARGLYDDRAWERRGRRLGGAYGTTLVIADPAFDQARYPGLRPLVGAAAEGRNVVAAYRDVRLLAGATASPEAVVAAMPLVAVVHFAGHAIVDDERPLQSRLLLSAEAGGSAGELTAGWIATLDLSGLRLVVLAACESVRSSTGHAGGLSGLAGAFLSAGAGGMLGALWRVEDGATGALMRAFHREYASTGDAAGALRAAQLELLGSNDPALRSPAAWAGFRYLGH